MQTRNVLQLSTVTVILVSASIAVARYYREYTDDDAVQRTVRSNPPYPAGTDENIFWFTQLSDIHISRYYDFNRSRDLQTFCGAHLPFIDPAFVLITGDLTDAKTADMHSSRQYADEWKTYQAAIHSSGALRQYKFLDMRGNHDGFDTPVKGGYENIYRSHSIHNVRSHDTPDPLYVHRTSFGNYSFVAVDAVPRPGPKRPFNFFGILDEERMVTLRQAVRESKSSNHTVFYSHYPSAIINQPYVGALHEILSEGIAYLSGHLHDLNGLFDHLYTQQRSGQLELELGDWKINRRFRVMAFDHDLLSFADVTFNQFPIVLITNPKDAMFSVSSKEPLGRIAHSSHIRVLVFSPRVIKSPRVWIDGKFLGSAKPSSASSHLYVLPWSPALYAKGHHIIKVEASDTRHTSTVSQAFALDGSRVPFHWFPTVLLLTDLALLFKLAFIGVWLFVLALILTSRIYPRIIFPLNGRQHMWFSELRCGLCQFGKEPVLFPLFLLFHVYLAVGPCIIAELLTGDFGFVFAYGVYLEGNFLPGSLTFLYATVQVILFHIPMLIYFAKILGIEAQRPKSKHLSLQSIPCGTCWALVFAGFALLWQTCFCRLLWKAYGYVVILLGPGQSWPLLLAYIAVVYYTGRH